MDAIIPNMVAIELARREQMKKYWPLFWGLFLAAFLNAPTGAAKNPTVQIGNSLIKLEVASTPEAIRRGLMYRMSMPEDSGMVFLFRPARPVRFWMFNCLMPLDMLFIKDNKIVKICHEVPPCKSHNANECPLYPESGEIFASEVIELNAGFAKRHAIQEGDSVQFQVPGINKQD